LSQAISWFQFSCVRIEAFSQLKQTKSFQEGLASAAPDGSVEKLGNTKGYDKVRRASRVFTFISRLYFVISRAEEVHVWLEKSFKLRRTASILFLFISITYLAWRLTIFNPTAPICSFFFFLAAVIDFMLGVFLVFVSWTHRYRTIPPVTRPYRVDVLIPVYSEPVAMIELTVMAAKEIDYPHETYLLDDGHREELREVARKHGVHYLARPTNEGAKAGNLNYGLQHSKAELVAVFDADHIAQREAIEKLVGFFDDPKIALAQAPQYFYNEDAFIYRDAYVAGSRWHEQAFFFDVSEPGRDTYNAASGVGTSVIYRRSALEDIGGFPTQTITEDIHISLRLIKWGWKTAWLNEPIAWGVGAADVPEYTRTRHRWIHGNIHAVCFENVLFCKGLTWQQRASYLCVAWRFLEGWQQLLYILIPAYIMFFYVSPIQISTFNISLLWAVPLSQILLGLMIGAGYVRFLPTQIFGIGRMHLLLAGTTGLFGNRMRWKVSLKNVHGTVSFSLLLPQILIAATGFLSILYALAREFNLIHHVTPARKVDYMVFTACTFIVFNIARSCYWIKKTIAQAGHTHHEYLFEVPVPITDEKETPLGQATRLSTTEGQAVWLAGKTPQIGQIIRFFVPGHTMTAEITAVQIGRGFSFRCLEASGLERLKRSLYSVDWHQQIRTAPYCHRTKMENLAGPWLPAIARVSSAGKDRSFWAVIQEGKTDGPSPRIIISESLPEGEKVTLQWFQDQRLHQEIFSVASHFQPKYQIPKDLNDRRYSILELDPTANSIKMA